MKKRISLDNLKIEIETAKKEIILDKRDFPMTMNYNGKRYILILTKNDKLILNKYED